MVISPVHQVWPKSICKAEKGGKEDKARQRKRWEHNIREWTGLEFGKSKRAGEDREKWRKMVAKSSGAPTTLAVKGYRMMMMTMIMNLFKLVKSSTGLKAQTTHHTLPVAGNGPKYTTGNLHKLHVWCCRSTLQSTLCADSYLVSVPPLCYHSGM